MAEEELNTENEEDLWAAAAEDLSQQKDMLKKAADDSEPGVDDAKTPAEQAPATTTAPAPPPPGDMSKILDIPLRISVELGRTKMLINDLLQLGQGSVIELSKLVGDPLEVKVNEKLVAKGEVVVINEKFGIRLTEVMSAQERIESLG